MKSRRRFCVGCVPLSILFALPVHSPTIHAGETWDGGGANNNWTTDENWNGARGNEFPPPNDGTADIVIAGTTRLTPRVDVDWDINSFIFNSTAGGFSISGDPAVSLGIGAGGITNNDTQLQIVLLPIDLDASQTWNAAAGPLSIGNTVAGHPLFSRTLTLDGPNNIHISGAIISAAALTKTGTGTLTFNGGNTNSYTGTTTVSAGTLVLNRSGGLNGAIPRNLIIGDGAGGTSADVVRLDAADQITEAAGRTVTVGSSGLLNLNGFNETVANLAINGGSVSGAGSLVVNESLTFTGGGSISTAMLAAPVSPVVVNEGMLNISGGGQVSNTSGRIGSTSGSNGMVSVGGAGSTWTNSQDLYVGDAGNGTLDIMAGGDVTNIHGYIGNQSGATGTVTVDSAGSTWTNSGSLIVGNVGSGTLTITNSGRVSNAGNSTIGSFSTGSVTVDGIGSNWDITNLSSLTVGLNGDGSLEITNGGTVTVAAPNLVNSLVVNSLGQINVRGDSILDAPGGLRMDGGSLMADTNATLNFGSGSLRFGASVTVQNGASLTHNGNVDLERNVTVEVTSSATYTVAASGLMRVGTLPGTAAELIVDGAGTLVSAPFAIDVGYGGTGIMMVTGGAGVETLTGAVGSFDPNVTGSVATLTLDGTDASGNPSSWVSTAGLNMGLAATSQGTINIRNGALFQAGSLNVGTPGSGFVFVEGLDGSGNPSLLDVNNLNIGGGGYGNGTGEVTASAGGRIEAGNVSIGGAGGVGDLTVTDAGSALVQTGAATITVGHASSGAATLNVQNNGRLVSGTGAINVNATGEINLNAGGVLEAHGPINMNGGDFNFLGGALHVDSFNGNLLNEGGKLAPGHSVGTTAISGNYTQRPAASLEIEIAGILPGDWDVLTAEGNASLDGTLKVVLVDDFEPVLGNSFTILTTNVGNVGGQFETELFPIFNGLTFDVVYNPQSVVLQVIEAIVALAGDYNGNGVVDAADYTVWQDTLGSTTDLAADGDASGTVDAGDYDLWKMHFGETAGVGAASRAAATHFVDAPPPRLGETTAPVPEPASLLILLISALVSIARWRGRS